MKNARTTAGDDVGANHAQVKRRKSARGNVLPPLLFLHGFRGAPSGLAEVIAELKKFCQQNSVAAPPIFAPALPPAMAAGKMTTYTVQSYADFVAGYIKKQGIKRPVLVGHSMGSLVAAATAERYPELVGSKLVLLAPVSARPLRWIVALQPLVATLPNRMVSYLTTRYAYIGKSRAGFKHTLALTIEGGEHYADKKALAASARFATGTALIDFPAPQQEAWLITGEQDRLFKKNATALLAQRWGAEQITVKNSGHLLNYERPRETAKAIWQALRS